MKNILIICLVVLTMFSCRPNGSKQNTINIIKEKKYLYVEISSNEFLGEHRAKVDTIQIIAENDSLAYLKAFEQLCISKKADVIIAEQLKAAGSKNEYKSTHDFKLFNEECEEVNQNIVPNDVLMKISIKVNSIK